MNLPHPIEAEDFVVAMRSHWQHLGNTTSRNLEALWHTMSETYAKAIYRTTDPEPRNIWSVLNPSTGAGKSQGLAVYAALCAVQAHRINFNVFDPQHPIAVLAVVRKKAQADELAKAVNEIADRLCPGIGQVAERHHSDHVLTDEVRCSFPVLFVTHQAYVNAVSAWALNSERYDAFLTYRVGPITYRRCLTTIDEALGNVISTSQVTYDNLMNLMRCIQPGDYLRKNYARELSAIETVLNTLVKVADDEPNMSQLYCDVAELPEPSELRLREVYDVLSKRRLLLGKNTTSQDEAVFKDHLRKTFESLSLILGQWRYYARTGSKKADGSLSGSHSFNTSSFLMPDGLVSPVCLDATASTNVLWDLMADRVEIVPAGKPVRSYARVRMHVAIEPNGLGNQAMSGKKGPRRAERLVAELNKKLKPHDEVLIISRKAVAILLVQALRIDPEAPMHEKHKMPVWFRLPNGAKVFIDWFGNIDGVNTYQNCTAVAIFGLPYPDNVWAMNMVFALQGYAQHFLDTHSLNGIPDYKRLLEHRQMALEVIQAINRVRCRRVVDAEGNCRPTQVFIILPNLEEGRVIREAIKHDMPGIVEVEWQHRLDDPEDRIVTSRNGKTLAPASLILLLDQRDQKETTWKTIENKLQLSNKQVKRLRDDTAAQFKAQKGDLYEAISSMNYRYRSGKPSAFIRLD